MDNKNIAQSLFNTPDMDNQENVRRVGELVLNNPDGLKILLQLLTSEALADIANAGEGEVNNVVIRKAQDEIQAYQKIMDRAVKYSKQAKEYIEQLDNQNN